MLTQEVTQLSKSQIPQCTNDQHRSTQYAALEEEVARSACLYLYDPSIAPVDTINTSLVSAVGLSMVSGFGGLLGFYIPGYVESAFHMTLKLPACDRG